MMMHVDDGGADDIVWPLAKAEEDAFIAAKLVEAARAGAASADEIRAIGLRLMRCGPPVGWLGALMVIDSNRDRRRP